MRLLALFAAIALAFWLLPQAWPFWVFAFMLSPGMCCCGSCTIFTDDFGSDDLATNWTVDSGSWSISGGHLAVSSTSARVVSNATASVTEISVTSGYSGASGDKVRLFLYGNSTNYVYGEAIIGTSLTLYSVSGGSSTTLSVKTVTVSSSGTLYLCIDPTRSLATFGDGTNYCSGVPTYTGGTKGGLGTGSVAASVTFTNYKFERCDTPTCPKCIAYPSAGCPAGCDVGKFPWEFLVTMSGFTHSGGCSPDCTAANGSWILTNVGSGSCSFQYGGPTPIDVPVCGMHGSIVIGIIGLNMFGVGTISLSGTMVFGYLTYPGGACEPYTPDSLAFNCGSNPVTGITATVTAIF